MSSNLVRQAVGVSASALLALSIIGPAAVSASTPVWDMTVTAVPPKVSPGAVAAYDVTVFNNGKSNISKLFLTDDLKGITPAFASAPCTKSALPGAGTLNCSLGALNAHSSRTVRIAYATSGSGSFAVNFEATTSGVVYSNSTSHGDILGPKTGTTTLSTDPGFAGGFVLYTSPISTTGGTQQTTINPPTSNIGVTIDQSAADNQCATGTVIGQLASTSVAGGTIFATPFLTTLTIDASGLPDEFQATQFFVCHKYDGASLGTLMTLCPSAPPITGPGIACYWPTFVGQIGDDDTIFNLALDADDFTTLLIDVWDFQNGGLRGAY